MDVFTVIATSSVVSTLIMWRTNRNTEKLKGKIQAELELLKGEISAESTKGIEQYKENLQLEMKPLHARLDRLEFEHQTRFTHLHEKRIAVIAEFYERYANIATMASILQLPDGTDDFPNSNEWEIEAMKKYQDIWVYFHTHKYCFDADFCRDIDDLFNTMMEAIQAKVMYLYIWETDKDNQESLNYYFSKSRATDNQIGGIEERIVTQLRQLMGVDSNEENSMRLGGSGFYISSSAK